MSASGNRRVASAILAALAVLAIAVLVATLATGGARADGSFTSTGDDLGLTVPGDHSAGDQYVETLPTVGGSRAPRKSKRGKKLPKHVARKLDRFGGADARMLEQLAGSAALGAPGESIESKRSEKASANGKKSRQDRARKHKRDGGSGPAVPSAAINAADRGEAGLEWLAIAILAITALSLGAVGYQRHRHKDSTPR